MAQPESERPNAPQNEEWNGATAERWLKRHEALDRQIAVFGRRTMERAEIRPGHRILDIGCGAGKTTLDLARRVGDAGFATGVDISRALLEAARKLAHSSNLSNVAFAEADAQTFPFAAGTCDLVFSRFGVMFFDNPEAAFLNLRDALKPGGRLAFVCWPAPQENLFVTIPATAASKHIALPQPREPDAPGPFAFADPNRVRHILSRVGFVDIEIERLNEKVGGGTIDETSELLLRVGPLDGVLDGVDATIKNSIKADIRVALNRFVSSSRVFLDAAAWLVIARSQ